MHVSFEELEIAECGEGEERVDTCMKYPAHLLLTFRFGRLGLGLYKLRSSHHACRYQPQRNAMCSSMTRLLPFWLKLEQLE